MPLVRYEIRNEHSLANPQLYRTAAKDDPEGLLEGVAMAGLVGIVRQLGDLAEFAAEVFRDLHEEVMATASRGHELLARVQQLEAEMPSVEKALLSETNQLRFAYTPGVDWHASIRNDQNHCTQGDLPRFIRSSYEECRGPPRLFLLDKFDVAGAGACLKRYTDPSFFRTEWASSELMKAERVQRDKRARREKKKGRRRRNVDGQESILAEQYQSRFSHELSREISQPNKAHPRNVPDAQGLRQHVAKTVSVTAGTPLETPDSVLDIPVPTVSEDLTSSQAKVQRSTMGEGVSRERDESESGVSQKDDIALQTQEEIVTSVADDGGSEGEQFLDALTTMEPEGDSDSETHLRPDRDADADQAGDTALSQPTSYEDLEVPELQTSADEKFTVLVEQSPRSMSNDPSPLEISMEPRVVVNGRDAKGASSFTTATHSRKQSSDFTSSSSLRNTKHVELLEGPHEGSRPGPEPYYFFKDEKRTNESSVQEPVLAKAQGVKVSKMVAAFESGSLEQVHVEVLEKEGQKDTVVPDTLGTVADTVNQPTGDPDDFEVSPAITSESNSRENSPRPLDTSPAVADLKFFKSHGSPQSDEEKCTSPSSRMSVGSLHSPPDSPTFSALQSPVSSIRTERNILLSPASQRTVFPAELLSVGSPTAVPILASSPTSQELRHPELFSLESGDGQEEPFSPTSSSSSSVHLPFTSQGKNSSEIASQLLASDVITENSVATLLSSVEDCSHLDSELPSSSVDEPLSSIMAPEAASLAPNSLEDLAELQDVSYIGQDLVHTPAGESELITYPRIEGEGSSHDPILSTSQSSNDYVSMSPSLNNKLPNQAVLKAEGKALLEPILPTSLPLPSFSPHDSSVGSSSNQDPPSKSPSVQDLTLPKSPPVEREKPTLPSALSRSFETSEFSYPEASLDSKRMPRAGHRRYPSLPLVEKSGPDFSHAIPSNSSRRSPESLLPSKAIPGAQLPAKFVYKTSSPSPMSRAVFDLPYPTVKAAHNRFHSFSSAEKSMLEVQSTPLKPSTSSSPSRHVPDTQLPASMFVGDLRSPSRTLSNLPTPTPPSKVERDFPPPPPPSTSPTLSATKSSAVVDVQDGLLEAIASHDKSTLKKVKTMQNPSLRKGDERSHLLEQIRAQSFNLRHTVVEKVDPPLSRPVTNINVAAILEKANAIRQAFAGSDEDDEDNDDWSDV